MYKKSKTKVISFVAFSGTGKTTFIEKLINEMKKRKLKLAVIKHDSHEFQMDKEGKDTYRYYKAGADLVNIFSKKQCATIGKNETVFGEVSDDYAPSLKKVLEDIPESIDVVIVEGCREADIPKIGVTRKATRKGLSMKPSELVALITDEKPEKYSKDNKNLRIFGLEDVKQVADFIIAGEYQYAGKAPARAKANKKDDYKFSATVDEVLEVIDEIKVKTKTELVGLNMANGRIAAKDYKAQANFPPFKRSPLDGYAFRSEDTKGVNRNAPVTFEITEEIPAGKQPEFPIKKGQAAKILTGAPIPKGADVVERFETTEFTDETVTVFREYKENTNIVPEGEDFKKGSVVIEKGTKLSCFDMGVLGILGMGEVSVYQKPKVAIISTGSELVEVECKLPDAKIRNSSAYLLGGMAENAGAESIYCGIVKDEALKIADEIRKASTYADIICTTGGASVGDYDLIMSALDLLGAKVLVWKVKMKPGMAFILAKYNNKIFMGLSGNPGAAAISFSLFGTTLIRKFLGKDDSRPEMIRLTLAKPFTKKSPGGRYVIGTIEYRDEKAYFVSNEVKGNGVISSLQGGYVVGVIPPSDRPFPSGTVIDAFIL